MLCLEDALLGRDGNVLHGTGGTAVSLIVVGTLGLVEGPLRSALAVVGLEAASDTVSGVGEALLDLLLGGLGGVRSDLLLSLCWRTRLASKTWREVLSVSHTGREILAAGVRHDD
jgi:hypothetical protein